MRILCQAEQALYTHSHSSSLKSWEDVELTKLRSLLIDLEFESEYVWHQSRHPFCYSTPRRISWQQNMCAYVKLTEGWVDRRPPFHLPPLYYESASSWICSSRGVDNLGEHTQSSISAKEDFTEESFDSGNSFWLQKNEEERSELVGVLSPGAWQGGVGALDPAGVDSGAHTQSCFWVQSLRRETCCVFCGSQTLPWFFSSPAGRAVLTVGLVQVEGSIRTLIGLLFQLGRRFPS